MAKMTIRQCMDATYQLINEYSIAGTVVPLSYNDQADLEGRMLNLINTAQSEIAATVKPINASMTYVVDEDNLNTGWVKVTLPDNFDRLAGVKFMTDDDFRNRGDYRFTEDESLYLKTDRLGTYHIGYYRFPVRYDSSTALTTELDNTPDTHEAIPYFCASVLFQDDDQYMYGAMHNEWELRLSRLDNKPVHAENMDVEDAYCFGGGY